MATRKYKKFQTGGYSEFGEEPVSGMMDFPEEVSQTASKTSETISESKPSKKAPIVTKEELAKSGLSLRDYMNKQLGLKRRDGSAPESYDTLKEAPKSSPKATTVEKTVVKTEAPSSTPRVGRASVPMATPPEMKGGTAAGQAAANAKREKQREGMFDNNPLAAIFKSIRKRGEETQGYAKGGSVSSASKRADGIAQRGKTRGKIC